MNSKQAAKKLKVSIRSLQRLAHKHNLTVTYQRGKSGKQEAHYEAGEIERLKDELAAPTVTVKESTELATIPDASRQTQLVAPDSSERFAALLDAITAKRDTTPTISDLAAKPLLTIAEAQRLTSLSRDLLLDAYHSGKLKLITIGRGYKIKREDLDQFIKKL
jgi:excisionase family DNA binding protein